MSNSRHIADVWGYIVSPPLPHWRYLLFYAGLLYSDTPRMPRLSDVGWEAYNGGYVYTVHEAQWYRCDATPMLLSDVPKELRTLVLLLT